MKREGREMYECSNGAASCNGGNGTGSDVACYAAASGEEGEDECGGVVALSGGEGGVS